MTRVLLSIGVALALLHCAFAAFPQYSTLPIGAYMQNASGNIEPDDANANTAVPRPEASEDKSYTLAKFNNMVVTYQPFAADKSGAESVPDGRTPTLGFQVDGEGDFYRLNLMPTYVEEVNAGGTVTRRCNLRRSIADLEARNQMQLCYPNCGDAPADSTDISIYQNMEDPTTGNAIPGSFCGLNIKIDYASTEQHFIFPGENYTVPAGSIKLTFKVKTFPLVAGVSKLNVGFRGWWQTIDLSNVFNLLRDLWEANTGVVSTSLSEDDVLKIERDPVSNSVTAIDVDAIFKMKLRFPKTFESTGSGDLAISHAIKKKGDLPGAADVNLEFSNFSPSYPGFLTYDPDFAVSKGQLSDGFPIRTAIILIFLAIFLLIILIVWLSYLCCCHKKGTPLCYWAYSNCCPCKCCRPESQDHFSSKDAVGMQPVNTHSQEYGTA